MVPTNLQGLYLCCPLFCQGAFALLSPPASLQTVSLRPHLPGCCFHFEEVFEVKDMSKTRVFGKPVRAEHRAQPAF